MKILLDNIVFELQKAGGISAIWGKHLHYLARNGYDFRCIEGQKAIKNIFRENLHLEKFVIPEHKVPLKFRRYLRVPTKGFDVFHSSYYRVPNPIIRNVVTVHDFMYEKFEKPFKRFVHSEQKKLALKRADAIICVSEHTKRDLLEIYPWVESKSIFVVYNGVDDDFFAMTVLPSEYKFASNIIYNKSFLLYVGSRGYCKNFPAALDAVDSVYAKDHGLKLVVVGGGAFTTDELEVIRRRNLESNIVKFDNVSSESLNILYNMARAFIFPSFYEGFGIPALEASRAKCPVISSNTSSIPEVVGNTPFSFNPLEAQGLIRKLELLDDHQCLQKAIEDALLHSLNFSWSKTSEETIHVYSHILGKLF